jgi:mono/diheme cytochrome c family protein
MDTARSTTPYRSSRLHNFFVGKKMKITVAVVCLAGLTVISGWAQTGSKPRSNSKPNPAVQRGKYLVTQVGLCQDCHTPRDQKGAYIQQKWLQGAPIMFSPSVEMPWAGTAPPIAGLEGWSDPQILKFLATGVDRDGKHPRPPMPEYRFNNADAKAVAAYLRSLKPETATEKSAPAESGRK